MLERNIGEINDDIWGHRVTEDGRVLNKDNKALPIRPSGVVNIPRLVGCPWNVAIHRLVALAFVPNPNNYYFVHFKDGNKHNRHYTNLEWVSSPKRNTTSVQMERMLRNGYRNVTISKVLCVSQSRVSKMRKELGL